MHLDVLIVGAGISGIGAAHHLKEKCPGKSFALFESKATFGGTWHTHTYPGIRSDSDLYTFGYRFKPWSGKPIATAPEILKYLGGVIEDDDLAPHIHYRREIKSASWSSTEKRWSFQIKNLATEEHEEVTSNFLLLCQGYYDHSKGYTPDWPGFADYEGEVVHPQTWPDDFSWKDKKVIVIGSGATAATLIPNLAPDAQHVTMLQRSPTYFWTGPNRNKLADALRALRLPESLVHAAVRWWLLFFAKLVQRQSAKRPEWMKEKLFKGLREYISEDDLKANFTPSYRPWQQRLAYVPDADLFKAIQGGKVSVVTDRIARFEQDGILTESGKKLEADAVITATGFNLKMAGGIQFDIDGEPLAFNERFSHRGMMISGVPNTIMFFGYLRTSWTMRVDMICDYMCRLLNHMDRNGNRVCVPTLLPEDADMPVLPWISEEEFNPGYIKRGQDQMLKAGDRGPWVFSPDYYTEQKMMKSYDLTDPTLKYS